MSRITGATSATPKHILLDAGCFFKNYDLTKTYAQNIAVAGALLGATDGGGTFSAVPVVHNVAIDGVPTNTKGLHRIDEWTVTMTARMKELTASNIAVALGAATSATVGSGDAETALVGATRITANEDIDNGDYLTNLTWVGRLSGSDDPVIIVMKNALSLNGFSINPADKAEAVGEYTLTGCYDLADLDDVPFAIYYPTVS